MITKLSVCLSVRVGEEGGNRGVGNSQSVPGGCVVRERADGAGARGVWEELSRMRSRRGEQEAMLCSGLLHGQQPRNAGQKVRRVVFGSGARVGC